LGASGAIMGICVRRTKEGIEIARVDEDIRVLTMWMRVILLEFYLDFYDILMVGVLGENVRFYFE